MAVTCTPPPPPPPPDTKISKAKNSATFTFRAIAGSRPKSGSGFQWALVKAHRQPKFKNCESPKRYKHLKPGKYTFEVRAFAPAGKDPTPAKRKFKIK